LAGAGQGVFGAAGGASGGQDLVFVCAAAVEVEREAPGAGAAAVTQSTQRERLVVAELTVEVGERAAEPDVKAQLRPVLGGWLRRGWLSEDLVDSGGVASPASSRTGDGLAASGAPDGVTAVMLGLWRGRSIVGQGASPMPCACAVVLSLSASGRNRLKTCSNSLSLPHRLVIRAKIVRLAAAGLMNAVIAARLGLKVDTVRKWRGRFATDRLDGLTDRPRSGRPPHFTPVQRAEVKAMACQLPATHGIALSRWSCPELAVEVAAAGIAPSMSASTVRRILARDAISPWQYRSWISIRDPHFAAKAKRARPLPANVGRPRASNGMMPVLGLQAKKTRAAPEKMPATPKALGENPKSCSRDGVAVAPLAWIHRVDF